MARPLLQSGDVWRDDLANAAGFPILDGSDAYGHGPKVVDGWLADDSDQIKSRFYGWRDRLRIVSASGLSVSYSGSTVLLPNKTTVSLSPGSLTLPDASTGFVFVSSSGIVTAATNLPDVALPLARYVTSDGAITTLQDLRQQLIEVVTPLTLPAQASVLVVGDVKWSARANPETDWLRCDGTLYQNTTWPQLFAAIGTTYNLPGDLPSTYRTPDLRGRVAVGSGQGGNLSARPTGQQYGSETHTLLTSEMPAHRHGLNIAPHSHGTNDPGHAHTLDDPGHIHVAQVGDVDRTSSQLNGEVDAFDASFPKQISDGRSILPSGTGISMRLNGTGISVAASSISASLANTGGNGAHSIQQPSLVLNAFIRAQ